MCLIVFGFKAHSNYPLLVVANRDEFYQRPTARADWWEDQPDLLAGKDLQAGGTWMGVSRNGRIAAITNYREGGNIIPNAPSRGALVANYLNGNEDPLEYLQRITPDGPAYNGYNLLVGTKDKMAYFSNRGGDPCELSPGIYGLSNHLLDTSWPKVDEAKQRLKKTIGSLNLNEGTDSLFQVLSSKERAPDAALPSTGVPLELERLLSPMFIESPEYGTRVSTVLAIHNQDQILYEERAFVPKDSIRQFQFKIKTSAITETLS